MPGGQREDAGDAWGGALVGARDDAGEMPGERRGPGGAGGGAGTRAKGRRGRRRPGCQVSVEGAMMPRCCRWAAGAVKGIWGETEVESYRVGEMSQNSLASAALGRCK